MASRAHQFCAILTSLGHATDNAAILDFGCGDGTMVRDYSKLGLKAHGCDIRSREDQETEKLIGSGIIRIMEPPDYRIPFEDNSFDLVTSDQVFEHVQEYDTALAEITRVLKPGGASLHVFPSRYKFIEPHQNIPFGTLTHNRLWLRLWAVLGIRNVHQRGLPVKEVVERNYRFLADRTNYLSKRQIYNHFAARFGTVKFVEDAFLAQSRRGRMIYKVSRFPLLRFLPKIYSALQSRVIFAAAPR